MSDTPPRRQAVPAMPAGAPRRTVTGAAAQRRRLGLFGLGLLLVVAAGAGFWLILQNVDQRAEYVVAARTIERWEVASAADFTVVEANVGMAAALTVPELGAVLGKWSTGRIPAGTLITEGLFETPPLSGESEADRVLLQVSLPSSEAPFGELATGDTVALLGRGESGPDGEPGALELIGVLTLEFVQSDNIYYVVTPAEALAIKGTVDRFTQASDRTMLKMGFDLTAEDLIRELDAHAASLSPAINDQADAGLGVEPVGDQ